MHESRVIKITGCFTSWSYVKSWLGFGQQKRRHPKAFASIKKKKQRRNYTWVSQTVPTGCGMKRPRKWMLSTLQAFPPFYLCNIVAELIRRLPTQNFNPQSPESFAKNVSHLRRNLQQCKAVLCTHCVCSASLPPPQTRRAPFQCSLSLMRT